MGLSTDLTWKSARGERKDHQLFDLRTRTGLITSEKYTLGSNGKEVWIKPGLDALGGTPPRFYMWTPFYFFGMPFVFADPGAKQESLGKKSFRGQEYDAVRITFAKGTGDTSDDYYVAYIDPATAQLKLVYYIVTYPAMRKDRPSRSSSRTRSSSKIGRWWTDCSFRKSRPSTNGRGATSKANRLATWNFRMCTSARSRRTHRNLKSRLMRSSPRCSGDAFNRGLRGFNG